jgi:NADH-quinone oxidoreductase subunit E
MTKPMPLPGSPRVEDQDFVDRLVSEYAERPGALLSILAKIQGRDPKKYLSAENLQYLAARLDIPLAQLYSFATFYALFNLEPQGRHTVCVCRGTACHTRGSRSLLERLKVELGVVTSTEEGGSADKISVTTPDGEFTLRTVACFGQCALAPVIEVDHAIFGHVNETTLEREVEAVRNGHAKRRKS